MLVDEKKNYRYIGKNIPRKDGVEKVTGTALYVQDMILQGMLYARIVKSPHAYARIKSIDTNDAEKMPGVRAVVTGKELSYKVGLYVVDKDILAKDYVRYQGEPVAAVAADTELIAEQACEKIKVTYEELEPVLDPREALKPEAPLVHPDLGNYSYMKGVFQPQAHTNIPHVQKIRHGDIEKGFKDADYIIEESFYNPPVQHVPLETHTVICQALPGDKVLIYTSAQSPFTVRNLFSVCFGMPLENIRVKIPYVGGGFGGKAGIHFEPLTYVLSKKAGGRPVKLAMTREEEFNTIPSRQGLYSDFKTGVTKNGKITALEIKYYWDAGAYADYGVNVGRAGAYSGAGPYEVPNCKIDSFIVYTNKVFGTAYRGFGHLEVHWGIERNMDIVARKIGMDPLKFRQKNVLRPGAETITGEKIGPSHGKVYECLDAVAKDINWNGLKSETEREKEKKTGKVRGKGVAVLHKAPAMPTFTTTAVILKFNENGSVDLMTSLTDYGQGTYTALAQIAAEVLKMPVERINVPWDSDTSFTPYDWQTVASKGSFMSGNATIMAAKDALMQIKEIAAQVFRCTVEDLVCKDEKVFPEHNPGKYLEYKQIINGYVYPNGNTIGGPVIGRGRYTAQGLTNLDFETGQGLPALDWTFGAHGAEVEVDLETGEIKVLNLSSAFDIGQTLNEGLARGQIIGGVIQGLGSALTEEFKFSGRGKFLNAGLVDYKILTAKDLPEKMSQHMIENPQMDGPFGARGVAEHPMISVPSVIGNAIYDALGIDYFRIPLTSERIYLGIKSGKKEYHD
ncbi:MAG: xanthine dehydrogenase family protein molybdopterin-binding subunit [Spirochaetes bacterium]|nr:xanthine dehydrogenase family protein molybdopterin-binding subunit [Spirochaetota bacterium]